MYPSLPEEPDDPVLTTREVADLLGIAVSTAQLWIENGTLAAWKTPGGHRRVRLSEVNALIRERAGLPPLARPHDAPAPVPGTRLVQEPLRLAALQATRLLESPAEAVFDRLTWLAAEVTGCPIAVLTLVTARRQWFKSRVGIALTGSPLEDAFCSHTIGQEGPLMVPDAQLDSRFRDSALVKGEPHVRFYAGFPLAGRGGHHFGALCVMDREPRRLRERELRALGELAAIAAEEIRRR